MLRRVDLHTHSCASDGTDTPAELVANAHKAGLGAVALTDHDTLSGLPEAQEAAKQYSDLEFVRGVEVSTGSDQGEMHILGLWVPEDAEPLENALAEMRGRRGERNERIVAKLCQLGCPITMDDVMREAGGESVGRPHIAMALMTKGYVKSIKEGFDKYLGQTGKAYLPKDVMEPEKAVSVMSRIGCSVVIAHPLLRPYPPGWVYDFAKRLVWIFNCDLSVFGRGWLWLLHFLFSFLLGVKVDCVFRLRFGLWGRSLLNSSFYFVGEVAFFFDFVIFLFFNIGHK